MLAVPSAQLSLGDDGVVVDPMGDALEILESAALDIPAMLREPATTWKEQPHPADGGVMSDARRNEILDKMSGVGPAR